MRREVVADGSRIVMGSRSLTINKLRLSDAGTYTCNASHPLTESVLTNVTIDVEGVLFPPPPTRNDTIREGLTGDG